MAIMLNPYLSFEDTAQQAMEFYSDIVGGELTVNKFGEYGIEGPKADQVMHAHLKTANGMTLMASDTPPGVEHRSGSSITISLSGDDAGELRGYWEKLADGGKVDVPLEKQVWGDEFGQLVDRFGIAWMVDIGPEG